MNPPNDVISALAPKSAPSPNPATAQTTIAASSSVPALAGLTCWGSIVISLEEVHCLTRWFGALKVNSSVLTPHSGDAVKQENHGERYNTAQSAGNGPKLQGERRSGSTD